MNSRVINQHIDPAVSIHHGLNQLPDLALIAYITNMGHDRSGYMLAHGLGQRVNLLLFNIDKNHGSFLISTSLSNGGTQSLGRARDQDYFFMQIKKFS